MDGCSTMRAAIRISGRLLCCAVALTAVVMLLCCGDLNEWVIFDNRAGGVVLVTDLKELYDYSLRTSAEWKRMPLAAETAMFGERDWIAHPPAGVFLQTGTKVAILKRRFLQNGQLVEPYPANSYDMQRNLAVEVIYVAVRDGQYQRVQGWLPHYCCRPTVILP